MHTYTSVYMHTRIRAHKPNDNKFKHALIVSKIATLLSYQLSLNFLIKQNENI